MNYAERMTSTATQELTRRIRERDGDPEFIASEFVLWLRGQGWRPAEATPAAWKRPRITGTPPTDAYLAARAELNAQRAERDAEAAS